MVGALHATGLQVVLDEVYNHTAASGQGGEVGARQGRARLLPAAQRARRRRDLDVLPEHGDRARRRREAHGRLGRALGEGVQGRRVPLRPDGPPSKENLLAVRAALDELTIEEDGVDGSKVYLYGEGWNSARSRTTRGSSRRRRVSSAAPGSARSTTGCATACMAAPGRGRLESSSRASARASRASRTARLREGIRDLGQQTDLVEARPRGQPPRLRVHRARRRREAGAEVDYNGAPAGYADQPDEVINYVDAHDNETLYDLGVFKLPTDTTMADRIRMNTLSLATVTFSQTPSFWHAGTELPPFEVARPQQLQLRRLVQPDRLDGPGVDVRLGPAHEVRQRGPRGVHGAAAERPGAEARGVRHRRGRGIRPRPAARALVGRPAATGFGRAHPSRRCRSRTAARMPRTASS